MRGTGKTICTFWMDTKGKELALNLPRAESSVPRAVISEIGIIPGFSGFC